MIDFTLSQNNDISNSLANTWLSENGITQSSHPRIYSFLISPEIFYTKYCPSLVGYAVREKRFLDFETPNRVQVTHEYDIKLPNSFDFKQYYYLFNPYNRLGWLKIRQGIDRITIAKSTEVRKIIIRALYPDLRSFSDSKNVMNEIWKLKKGLPCFIKLNNSKNLDFILSTTYYESIKQDKQTRLNRLISFFNPIKERRIRYSYYPLEKSSSWLYIKAPEHFLVEYYGYTSQDNNSIETTTITNNREPDPEKISLTIINKCNPSFEIPVITFGIKVPMSLKRWYIVIYILSLIIMGLSIYSCINRVFLKFFDPLIFTNFNPDFLSNDKFSGIILALIAAIITTRGWLIHEETILRKFAVHESNILFLTIIFYLIGILF